MFGPFQDIVVGTSGLGLALAVLQLGLWAIRTSARAAADVGTYGE